MKQVEVKKRIISYHPGWGSWVWVIGSVSSSLLEWPVVYVWVPYKIEEVRGLDIALDFFLEGTHNITYIGAGQQHWMSPAVREVLPTVDGCWLGWDWMGKESQFPELDELHRMAYDAYCDVHNALQEPKDAT